MSDHPDLIIEWPSGHVGNGDAIRIMARRGGTPVEIIIYRSEAMAASALADNDILQRIGGMHPWLEDAIAQAFIAGRLIKDGDGPNRTAVLLVMRQDFDLTGDRIAGPRSPPV